MIGPCSRVFAFFLTSVLAAASTAPAANPSAYPAPAPPADPSTLGLGVQRTMTLLATSTPERRNKVRVLFYGQSITEQAWSKAVAADLRRRFPHADLEVENRAIGGFASSLLVRPAEHDLYPFYPDLLIFHVYGANNDYERIIRNVRRRTTAEVLMQLDHVAAKWPQERPDEKADKGLWWDWMMNHRFLPEIAKKYGCGLVDVRTPWLAYLRSNKLEPQALLKDGVHLNDHGDFLMASLVGRYLVHRPDLPDDAWRDLVRTAEVGKDIAWNDGRLTLELDGNRVDAIAAPGASKGAAAKVLIDGKRPGEFAGCYRITRPQPGPWSALTVTRVDHDARLVAEDWTLRFTNVDDPNSRAFEVTGSVTGPDGAGSTSAVFTSKSGRVKIDPGAWFGKGNVKAGYEIKWKVLPMFVESYEPAGSTDPSREDVVTLVQGLPNGRHTLELVALPGGATPPPIAAIRVYRPPVKAEER